MEGVMWFLIILLGLLGVYVLVRLVTKAILRSYFEEKYNELKKMKELLLTKEGDKDGKSV